MVGAWPSLSLGVLDEARGGSRVSLSLSPLVGFFMPSNVVALPAAAASSDILEELVDRLVTEGGDADTLPGILMSKGDRTRFDRRGAVGQGNRGLVDRHATHGTSATVTAGKMRSACVARTVRSDDGDRQPEERRHTGSAKSERAQRRR